MIKWLKVLPPSKLPMEYVLVSLVGKHPEKKYDVGKAHRAKLILDFIHNDVVGHMPTNPINDCR